ncbi:S41 family peptidase [Robertkochia solimangrovi]|uniref:S41 family peptidase n=1 Tax=Robertkochia solimangrovi TaxID=2213046 RepID=UPI00117D5C6E|nr:S41 family peptidase [Robertkochia solimangrovi]TRZ41638.1 hypothetical protein DMZ48_16655 [Robertkochia solimangrovi]
MKFQSGLIIVLSIIVSSCQDRAKNGVPDVNGVWESVGSGWILQIKDSTNYSFYDITSISCLPSHSGRFEEISESLTLLNDTLSLQKGVITYKFVTRSKMPELCQNLPDDALRNDPVYNFEVFSETVKEHYAFFKKNHLDWNTVYAKQREKITAHTTPIELYGVIEETLEILKDNHAFLEADEALDEMMANLPAVEEETIGNVTLPEYGDFVVADLVTEHHLLEEMTQDSWLIRWGKLTDQLGYIQVKAMWLYADLNVPKALVDTLGFVDAYIETFYQLYEGNYIDKEVLGVRKIMDHVMNDLSGMEAMIIDLRFNGGGQDAVSFEILSRFIPYDKFQVATQKLRTGDSYSSVLPLYIEGSKNAYTKPTYLLTSQQTGSAAEAFAIATLSLKPIQRIGAPTSGAMSTALEKTLPNGWAFAISNEVYMDNNGINYENAGIPVDYSLNYPKDRQEFFRSVVNDLEGDKESILHAIIELRSKE